ncbi:nuclear pore complex protein NUP35-like [Cornus florida]|uniref:nuclear pore complex protein NUP35-like n=1 Tax=Cornus florida TaxID=4283 RepID=UPI0028A0733E|nr:nuclear pore complex protein NUP35-like [Cornus florida]
MSPIVQRTPISGRNSVFFHDLATPVSARRGGPKSTTPGQAEAVSAVWSENFPNSHLPPPPIFTLQDRSDFSPESGIPDYREINSDPRTPVQSSGRVFSTPKSKYGARTSYAVMGRRKQNQQGSVASLSWWSPMKNGGSSEQDDKMQCSPVEGVVQSGALLTLPPPEEVARPEMHRNTLPVGDLDEEEWVTVYGFSPGDTNLVLQEFEKCGVILKHVPGLRDANWMHILFQNRYDAHKALNKNGMQINGVVIIGVKAVDPIQHQALNGRLNNQGFVTLPPAPCSKILESKPLRYPCYLQNGSNGTRESAGTIATPAKSMASKIIDLMFGV